MNLPHNSLGSTGGHSIASYLSVQTCAYGIRNDKTYGFQHGGLKTKIIAVNRVFELAVNSSALHQRIGEMVSFETKNTRCVVRITCSNQNFLILLALVLGYIVSRTNRECC